jgi:hypothetical protein
LSPLPGQTSAAHRRSNAFSIRRTRSSQQWSTRERSRPKIGVEWRSTYGRGACLILSRHSLLTDDFLSLTLKATETRLLSDSAWATYEKDNDVQSLATKHAMFFRAVFAPTLASFLDAVRAGAPGASATFADRLTSGLQRRLAASPAHINSLVQILVVANIR